MKNTSSKIIVLDGHTLNPGDLSWERLQNLGDCEVFDRTSPDQVIERAGKAEIVVVNKALLPGDVISEMPTLRFIAVSATGYNVIDIEAARGRGITVSNVPVYGTRSVAQMVFAHLLNLTQRVGEHSDAVRTGRWASSVDWCFWDYPLLTLENATIGIVGFGRIGQATARLASAFGMRVLAATRTQESLLGHDDVEFTDLDMLFQNSDVVSLHCPLTPDTEGLVTRERLAMMKSTAYLINTSRGALVDEEALAEALNAGRLAGAGLDVVRVEPPVGDNPLFRARNCYVTPHIGWATHAARSRLLNATIDNVAAFLDGHPQNVVNQVRLAR